MTFFDNARELGRFRRMCELHDLTYEYSDDNECWKRGKASLQELILQARKLANAGVKMEHIELAWNMIVDKKISERGEPKLFYWKEDWWFNSYYGSLTP